MAPLGFFGRPNIDKMKRSHDTDGLIRALEYPNDPAIRSAAAIALGETGDSRAVGPLIHALTDGYEEVCVAAFKAIRIIGRPAVAPLMAELRDDDSPLHDAIAKELVMIGENGAVEPLVAALAGENERVVTAAAVTLAEIGAPAVPPLIAELQSGESPVRDIAAAVLAYIGTPAVRRLVAALMDNDPGTRRCIAGVLKEIGPAALPDLTATLIAGDLRQRHGAAEALGYIRDPTTVEPLIHALDDMNPDVRQAAAESLVAIGEPAVHPLTGAMKIAAPGIRDSAADVLEQIGAPAVPLLIEALEEPDSGIRDRAADLLGRCGDPAAALPLAGALDDPDGDVRQAAAEALGKIGDLRAVGPLIALLDDPDGNVRMRTIEALIRIGDGRATDPLLTALREETPEIRSNSRYVLGTISRVPKGDPLMSALFEELEDDEPVSATSFFSPAITGARTTFNRRYTDARGYVYELFRASTPEKARAFLKTKSISHPDYYLIVETPDGNWGLDRDGLFLEHLEPWQGACTSHPDGEGTIISWNPVRLEMAARGLADNFVCDVRCGRCGRVWTDGLRYQDVTAVRCPGCGAVNRVDSARAVCYSL